MLEPELMNIYGDLALEEIVNLATWELSRRRFDEFLDYANGDFIVAAHHRKLFDVAHELVWWSGVRYVISLPPRHSKSEIFSVWLPAFYLGAHPDREIIHVSHSSSLSNDFSRRVRAIVRDNMLYRMLFPATHLDPERSRVDDWRTTLGGGFRSVGVQGGITGRGAHFMIIDDPVKEGDEHSPGTLDATFDWYVSAARTRLAPGANMVLVMTRWAPRDLAGRVLQAAADHAESDQWKQIVLPALALENDPLGREPGEALWPERYSVADLQAQKALSPRYFQSLFQQEPVQEGTKLFYADKFMRHHQKIEYSDKARFAWCFDLALGEKEESDFTALALVVYDYPNLYFSNIRRFRWEWPKTKKLIKRIMRRFSGDFVFPKHLLELLAVQELRYEMSAFAGQIHEVFLPGDKRSRAQVLADRHENGHVYVVAGRRGDAFVREHDEYPGVTDDMIDVGSVATHYFGLASEFMAFIRNDHVVN